MKPRILAVVVTLILATVGASAEPPELNRREAQRLKDLATQAKAEGRMQESDELWQKAKKIEAAAERPGKDRRDVPHEKLRAMKRQIGELRNAGKDDEAERLQRELAEMSERDQRGRREEPAGAGKPEGPERVRHAMEAVKHLHAAGLQQHAAAVEEAARRLREQFERQHARGPGEPGDRAEGRRRNNRGRVKATPQGPVGGNREVETNMRELRAQMQKIAQELENLRGEVKKQRSEQEKPQ